MQRKGGPRLLITDREGALYLERAHVHVEGGRMVYRIADDAHAREFNIPHVNLAVLFLGQGTSITQEAMRLLGEERVHLAVTGSGGTPLHMGALTTYTATAHLRRLLPVYHDTSLSLRAAVAVMRGRIECMRSIGGRTAARLLRARDLSGLNRACDKFETELVECRDLAALLGHEGTFTKRCYAEFAGMAKLPGFRRMAGIGDAPPDDGDPATRRIAMANRLIDHGNYLCYGMAGAALWTLGIPPHLSVFHGKTRAGGLVFDIADAFKDALVLPLAFHVAQAREPDMEAAFRARLIHAFDDHKILAEAVGTVDRMLTAAEAHPDA